MTDAACDEDSFETLMEPHREAIFRLAYLILGDPDEAKDVLQEVYITVFQNLHRFDTARSLRPWLLRIAVNLARNHRRALRRYIAMIRRFFESKISELPSPEENENEEDVWALWHALRRLPLPDQQVIYLRYLLEIPIAETAEILNIAPGTVQSRLHRALKRLRGVIEHDFPALMEEYSV